MGLRTDPATGRRGLVERLYDVWAVNRLRNTRRSALEELDRAREEGRVMRECRGFRGLLGDLGIVGR
jgi:hypothetical protein